MDLENLRPFCLSAEQEAKLDAVIAAGGNQSEAARELGVNHKTVNKAMTALRARASAAPQESIKGRSTLRDADGNTVLEWTKTHFKFDQAGAQKAFLDALVDAIPKASPISRRAKAVNTDLCNTFILTDFHLGMNSWKEETGANWDTDIAEGLLVAWFAEAIRMAPKAHTAVLGQLGDFIHWDGLDAVTPASGHLLDADTRFQLVVRVAIRALRRIIAELLKKHENVHIIMAEGNHDPASSIWLRETFSAMYADEPRITVDLRPDPYYCFEWGLTSLFFHHGHKRKIASLDDVWVGKFREVFGRTKYSYGHCGHLHHTHALETNLMTVEQHRTLASPDAYAARGGWLSGRSAPVITYSKDHGEVGRLTISPEMVG